MEKMCYYIYVLLTLDKLPVRLLKGTWIESVLEFSCRKTVFKHKCTSQVKRLWKTLFLSNP